MSMARCQPARLMLHVGVLELHRRGEGDGVDEEVQPPVGRLHHVERADDVFVVLHVAGKDHLRPLGLDQVPHAALVGLAGQMGEGQFGPRGIQRLAQGPGNAVIVRQAHDQADFLGKQSHG